MDTHVGHPTTENRETMEEARDVEAGKQTQRGKRRPWRWVAAAIAVTLCVAAAVLLTSHTLNPAKRRGDSDMHLKLRQLAGEDKAAIHLEGEYKSSISSSSVTWSDNSGHAFFHGDLKLSNNEIVIPHSGLYFVYSQASYSVSCHAVEHDPDAGKLLHVSHAVERHSKSYDDWMPLLASTHSVCRKVARGQDNWYNAVYLGAVFSLFEGDRLRTQTQKELLPSLESLDGKTFFGTFAL